MRNTRSRLKKIHPKDTLSALITSFASIGVAFILGIFNIYTTNKQIDNQNKVIEKQITSQYEILAKNLSFSLKQIELTNSNYRDNISIAHKNSLELMKETTITQQKYEKSKKINENKQEVKIAAKYVLADIQSRFHMLLIYAQSRQERSYSEFKSIVTKETLLDGEILSIANQQLKILPKPKLEPPPNQYLEKLPIEAIRRCLSFYESQSIFWNSMEIYDQYRTELDRTFNISSPQFANIAKYILKLNKEESWDWLIKFRHLKAREEMNSKAMLALEAIVEGQKAAKLLDDLGGTTTKYNFNVNKIAAIIRQRSKNIDAENNEYLKALSISKEDLINAADTIEQINPIK